MRRSHIARIPPHSIRTSIYHAKVMKSYKAYKDRDLGIYCGRIKKTPHGNNGVRKRIKVVRTISAFKPECKPLE